MCGIFALLNSESGFYPQKFIEEQFEKGKGRGPEHSILKSFGKNTLLGFHRLAINGLNSTSNQPIVKGNLTLICNGEIYNYKQLYEILGIEPKTQSDCEVILHLYERFGIERCLQLLDGVFAFILLDYNVESDAAKLYAARDPFGVRPMYVLTSQHLQRANDIDQYKTPVFGFASELKCLSDFQNNSSIEHLIPGTYQVYTQSYQVSSFWELENREVRYHIPSTIPTQYAGFDYSEISTRLAPIIQNTLREAVEKRCSTTERPIACLLSGGLDSSLITSLVNDFHKKNGLPPLETYSIGLPGSVDIRYARIVADYLGTKHTEIILEEEDFLNAIPEVIHAIESYDTTSVRASIGNYLLGKYISANSQAKVIFNGDGSDELTGGYLYFHKASNSIEFDIECRRLLGDIYLYDVLRSDKCISTHGLEPRTPFLDRGWVEGYLSIPAEIRCHSKHGVCEKHLLRLAFDSYKNLDGERLLPKEVIWRTKEAFSDGVSQQSRSLYEIIQEHVQNKYMVDGYLKDIFIQMDTSADSIMNQYKHNPPKTLEQQYYRYIFEEFYPGRGGIVPYMWMPRFIEGAIDASARTLKIYNEINEL
jgi:asparagine synthase (glutamine-hydrolysing)